MSVSIKPLEDRVVVRPLEAEQVTASGLRVLFVRPSGLSLD